MQVAKTNKQQAEIDEIFAMMEQAIRLNDYGSDDLLYMVADLIPVNPTLASAIAQHAGDFMKNDAVAGETTWTDIVVEAYRRALFDLEKSPLYGTGYMVNKIDAMRAFVTHYISNHSLEASGGGHAVAEHVQ
jgi:hypothetical protein